MVLQQKLRSATKIINKKVVQSPKPSMFELDANDEDNDDLDIEIDSIVVQDPLKTAGKKTPQAKTHGKQTLAKQTPNKLTSAKQAPGKKTSAKQMPGKQTPVKQTPGKQTPDKQTSGKQTPGKQTPGKQTPGKRTPDKHTSDKHTPGKQTPDKQTPGQQTPDKQTPGQQTPDKQTPGKQTLVKQPTGNQTPNKKNSLVSDKQVGFELATAKTPKVTNIQVGKRQATPTSNGIKDFRVLNGLNNKSKTPMKMKDDDEEEDEVEDDDDEEVDAEEDDDEEDDDDDDEEEVDDEEEDDDEEDDDDDEEDDEEEEEDDVDAEEVSKQNSIIECKQNLKHVKNKTPVNKEAPNTTETDFSSARQNEKHLALVQQNKIRLDLRDARCLMLKYLPVDIRQEEVKSLSDDIINVILQDPEVVKKRGFKNVFVFVEFASEEKAAENYAAFQNQKLRGKPITLDYVGVKSKDFKEKEFSHNAIYNTFNRLRVSGLPINIKINQIAKLTPNATAIILILSNSERVALVTFDSEEKAAEAFEANKEAKINGKPVTFLYLIERKFEMRMSVKRDGGGGRPFSNDGQPPFAKKPRQDLEAFSQDYAAFWKNFSK